MEVETHGLKNTITPEEIIEIINRESTYIKRNAEAAKAIKKFKETKDYYDSPFFKAIDAASESNSGGLVIHNLPKGTTVYRARLVHTEDIRLENGFLENGTGFRCGFDEMNSMEAPLGKTSPGRNNIRGMSYLYVAEDIPTACAELKSVPKSLISVAEIELVSDLKIFDFTNGFYTSEEQGEIDVGVLFTEAAMQFYRPVTHDDEYEVTQIISDYIRKTGVDGIAYRSFFTWKKNYTIFNSHKSKVKFKSSKLLANQGSVGYFWDFNGRGCIAAKHKNLDYEEEHSEDVKQMVIETLKESEGESEQARV